MYRKTLFCCLLAGGLALPARAENLAQLYQQALAGDPLFKSAESERRAIYERRPQAEAGLLPSLSAGASYSRNWSDGRGQDATRSGYSLTLVQPLYDRGSRIAVGQADSEIDRAEADYLAAQQDLAVRMSSRYFDVLAALDGLDFARNNKAAIQRQLDQTKQRFEVGLIAITDVQESQAAYDLAVAEEIVAINALENAQEALREVTGLYHQQLAGLGAESPLLPPEPADIDAWTEQALRQSPAVIAAQAAVEAARQDIERSRAGHYPQVDLVAQHSYSDVDGSFNDGYTRDNSVGVQLSLPIDIAGGVRARTREAQARYQKALDNLERQRRAVQSQVHQAYLSVISGISQVKALQQAVLSNQTAYEATQTGFEVGTRTSVDVLNAQKELLRAQRDHSKSRYNYLLNTLRLKQAAGSLSEADLLALSGWLTENPDQRDEKTDGRRDGGEEEKGPAEKTSAAPPAQP